MTTVCKVSFFSCFDLVAKVRIKFKACATHPVVVRTPSMTFVDASFYTIAKSAPPEQFILSVCEAYENKDYCTEAMDVTVSKGR